MGTALGMLLGAAIIIAWRGIREIWIEAKEEACQEAIAEAMEKRIGGE